MAVKLVCEEDRASTVWSYCRDEAPVWITNLCFYETLGVLKAKFDRKELSQSQYLSAFSQVLALAGGNFVKVDDIPLQDDDLIIAVENLAKRYGLDMSDALQIYSVKAGQFRGGAGPSRTVLATADETLGKAAEREGLRVWNVMTEDRPPT